MKNKFGRFSWILYGITLPHAHYKYSTTTTWYSVAATFGKSYIEMIKGCQNVNYVLRLQNTKAYTVGFAFEMCSICHIKPYECGSFPHIKSNNFCSSFSISRCVQQCSILDIWSIGFQHSYSTPLVLLDWTVEMAWIIIDMVLVCLVVKINWILHRNCAIDHDGMPILSVLSIFFTNKNRLAYNRMHWEIKIWTTRLMWKVLDSRNQESTQFPLHLCYRS